MKIAFFGHAEFYKKQEFTAPLLSLLEERIKDDPAEIFFGGYGEFDSFAHRCCQKYKESHPGVRLVFVTPYYTEDYQKRYLEYIKKDYDEIVYPEIEKVPKRFAISKRNLWMAQAADLVICYVEHDWGGAYKACHRAARMKKEVINLAPLSSDEHFW